MMGMGGRYLDTRLTVRPDCTITMISPALIFSAVLHKEQERGRQHSAGVSARN